MDGNSAAIRDEIAEQLAEGYRLWDSVEMPTPAISERFLIADALLSAYEGDHAANLAIACQSFWLFRKLHGLVEENPVYATLLGDYFFSVFSKNLIPLDSVALNDAFAKFLSTDVEQSAGIESYKEFVRNLPAALRT